MIPCISPYGCTRSTFSRQRFYDGSRIIKFDAGTLALTFANPPVAPGETLVGRVGQIAQIATWIRGRQVHHGSLRLNVMSVRHHVNIFSFRMLEIAFSRTLRFYRKINSVLRGAGDGGRIARDRLFL